MGRQARSGINLPRIFGAVRLAVALGLAAVMISLPVASAQSAYYAGKTIEIIVPFAAGGSTDVQARLFAPFFEKHIAGNPRVIVRNMTGGGGVLGGNWFAHNAKPDGLTILMSSGSNVIPYMLQFPAVRYDYRNYRLISANGVGGVFYTSPMTGVKQPADLKKPAQPLVFGGISATGLDLAVLLAFELLQFNVRVVMGFEGRGPTRLAFERGEINLDYQASTAYLDQVVPLVKQGKAVPLFSMGFVNEKGLMVRDPSLMDVPSIYEVYQQMFNRKPDGMTRWKAFRALTAAAYSYQKTLWVHKGTPPEAVTALLTAVDKMNADREFVTQSSKILEGYAFQRGDVVEGTVLRSLVLTLDVLKFIQDLLTTRYNVTF
jgi:tripartite-type tricarboxylate transporter receptor subunit TctC